MISAVKQCWHMRNPKEWTDRCLVTPATCSVVTAEDPIIRTDLDLKLTQECIFTILTSHPTYKVGIRAPFYAPTK